MSDTGLSAEVRERVTQVLSVAPVFDARLAGALAARVVHKGGAKPTSTTDELGQTMVRDLATRGAIHFEGGWARIVEPLRSFMLDRLRSEDKDGFAAAALIAHAALANGSREVVERALGVDGARLSNALLGLAGDPSNEDDRFDDLVEVLQEAARGGRLSAAASAARLLPFVPYTAHRPRQQAFLDGLALWNMGERDAAAPHFEEVHSAEPRDRVFAISAHLLAVRELDDNELERAKSLAEEAIDVLEGVGDTAGLVVTLATLGRVQREIAGRDPKSNEKWSDAINTFRKAIDLAEPDFAPLALRSRLFLAGTYTRGGQAPAAAAEAERAIEILDEMEGEDEDLLEALLLLGTAQKATWRLPEAVATLKRAIQVAERLSDTRAKARTLNVISGLQRKRELFPEAVEAAQESVDIGEDLDDPRHLSQAYNTLAMAQMEAAEDRQDLLRALDSAERSRRLLKKIGDKRGLKFASQTIADIKVRLADHP